MTERGPSAIGWPWRIQAADYVRSREVAMALPDYEVIENSYKAVGEDVRRIPESTETREALRLVDIAEKLTYEARERSGTTEES